MVLPVFYVLYMLAVRFSFEEKAWSAGGFDCFSCSLSPYRRILSLISVPAVERPYIPEAARTMRCSGSNWLQQVSKITGNQVQRSRDHFPSGASAASPMPRRKIQGIQQLHEVHRAPGQGAAGSLEAGSDGEPLAAREQGFGAGQDGNSTDRGRHFGTRPRGARGRGGRVTPARKGPLRLFPGRLLQPGGLRCFQLRLWQPRQPFCWAREGGAWAGGAGEAFLLAVLAASGRQIL